MNNQKSAEIVAEIFSAEPERLAYLRQFFDDEEIRALLWSFYKGYQTDATGKAQHKITRRDQIMLGRYFEKMVEYRMGESVLGLVLHRKLLFRGFEGKNPRFDETDAFADEMKSEFGG